MNSPILNYEGAMNKFPSSVVSTEDLYGNTFKNYMVEFDAKLLNGAFLTK